MRIPRIYTALEITANASLALDKEASNHVGRALRMRPGQQLVVFNGNGSDYAATITGVTKKEVVVLTAESQQTDTESPLYTHIGQVISRGDRMDYMIQKSTELGASEITPLLSERCEVKLKGDREGKKVKHWQQIAIAAAEQCGRAKIPLINAISPIEDWIKAKPDGETGLVLHHRTTQHLSDIARPEKARLLIGPEGGLSEAEITTATQHGFTATTLGPRVLRTETAPLTALSILQWLWGDFNQ